MPWARRVPRLLTTKTEHDLLPSCRILALFFLCPSASADETKRLPYTAVVLCTMKFLVTLTLLPCLATCFTFPSFPRVAVPSSTSLFAANGENGLLEKKKVIVLGGDGFCGWPTSLYLSDQGHDVVIVDNLSRRNIDTELGCDSLTPIQPMEVGYSCRFGDAIL